MQQMPQQQQYGGQQQMAFATQAQMGGGYGQQP